QPPRTIAVRVVPVVARRIPVAAPAHRLAAGPADLLLVLPVVAIPSVFVAMPGAAIVAVACQRRRGLETGEREHERGDDGCSEALHSTCPSGSRHLVVREPDCKRGAAELQRFQAVQRALPAAGRRLARTGCPRGMTGSPG